MSKTSPGVGTFPSDPALDYYNQAADLRRTLQRATEEIQRLKRENEYLKNLIKGTNQ